MSSPQQDDFRALMERVRAGCPNAGREVYDRYSGHIRRVVRRRLNHRLRAQYDSMDFLQDVWASFFRSALDRYVFKDANALVGFLAELAYNKVTDACRRRLLYQQYNLNFEQSLEGSSRADQPALDPPQRTPTPSQVAIAKEHWERLLDGQPDRCRLMLEMLRQGHSHAEIAERTGLHLKMIQRLLNKMAQRRDMQ
jgi:RNA polymerase sigma factor (sigma-70 family)